MFAQAKKSIANFIKLNDINLWYQTFGNSNDQPLLLINGGGPRASMWPEKFCEMLANAGFFVIRYDHRDSGYSSSSSSSSSSSKAYDLKVLAEDANGLLEALHISRANIIGASMGGWVAMILAAHYPAKISSLICMITGDLNTFLKTNDEIETKLSKPTNEYMNWLKAIKQISGQNDLNIEETIKLYLACWRICNGKETPFDENLFRTIVEDAFLSSKNKSTLNSQFAAMQRSAEQGHVDFAMANIKTPTLVIQGSCDPIFQSDHGRFLAESIPNAKLRVIKGMGHVISPYFYEKLVTLLREFVENIEYTKTYSVAK